VALRALRVGGVQLMRHLAQLDQSMFVHLCATLRQQIDGSVDDY
jgi:hypothetical protein